MAYFDASLFLTKKWIKISCEKFEVNRFFDPCSNQITPLFVAVHGLQMSFLQINLNAIKHRNFVSIDLILLVTTKEATTPGFEDRSFKIRVFLYLPNSVNPIFFCISDMNNSTSNCSKKFKNFSCERR